MRVTLDTEKGIWIIPNTCQKQIDKMNAVIKKAGADKEITVRTLIEEAIEEAWKRPVLTAEQAKDWNPDLESQIHNK